MTKISELEPREVFSLFDAVCAIPHGSGNTAALADFCLSFAKEHGLEAEKDAGGNVIIRRPATAGREGEAGLILQGHLDMVCAAQDGNAARMAHEPVHPVADGDRVTAQGTSLGADNGIGLAMILAMLADETLSCPPMEAVFTADEETGMYGAEALELSRLHGRRLINLDSEEEGCITVGCAGGVRADCSLPLCRVRTEGVRCTVSVGGLRGGHSGGDITLGRGNACRLLGRALRTLAQDVRFCLLSVTGGTVENAIPVQATAEILVTDGQERVMPCMERVQTCFADELKYTDTDVTLTCTFGGDASRAVCEAVTPDDTDAVLFLLCNLPNGVQHMSPLMPELPQTSLNLGVMTLEDTCFRTQHSLRSSVATQKEWMQTQLADCLRRVGGTAQFHADYPAWEYHPDSPLLAEIKAVYRAQYGSDPKVIATHGGLECGLFVHKAPELDCVSIGPDIFSPHSAGEAVSIPSVGRTYAFVRAVVASKNGKTS